MILDAPESRPLWRVYLFVLMIVAGLAVLLVAMGYRQLIQGEYWTEQMAQSSTRAAKIPAPRGNILDRNRIVLVDNRPSYNVALYLDEFRAGRNNKKLLSAVRQSVETLKQRMKIRVNVNDKVVLRHSMLRGPLPLTVWNDLTPASLAAFAERSPWMQGVDLQIDPVRVYPFRALAAHVLGFVGKPETQDDAEFDSFGPRAFSQTRVVGKAGIEATMDGVLQGSPGLRIIRLNAAGLKESEERHSLPVPGNNVILSLDHEIQSIVEECFTGFRGACVILDPRNGDVLAMASMPSFDPNDFIPSIKKADWQALMSDDQHPLINRAIQGSYCPGSTIKVVFSLAALESGLITPSTKAECLGVFYLGNIPFHCWNKGGHGDVQLRDAITMSCNIYFYNLGMKLGGPRLWEMAGAFGLGQRTGIPLDHEMEGLLPTEEFKQKRNPRDRWTTGDSVNMAIGQGMLNVTPLQMAVVAAAMANGGAVYKPRLTLYIETANGEVVTEFKPEIHGRIPATPEHIQFVREAMANVVEAGTGTRAALKNIKVAAKTGSAQFKVRDPATGELAQQTRTWMISFAPFQEPRYAMALIAEGGESGGHTAAPIVGAIYKKIFELETDRKNPQRPVAVPALPVTGKIGGLAGEVSGELLGDETGPAPVEMEREEDDDEPPPSSVPAARVNLP